ncbi:MAG TPA: sugar-binding transcriptional regulator [Bacillales bacterium]|nr:sugar-binding transcriptional regulator [Bacillales bacterium]
MSRNDFTENMMVKVAWYYYKENLTQTEIADLLDLSRNKIVRLLEGARSEGIVQFHIKGTGVNCLSIENEMKETFDLGNAFVIPSSKGNLNNSLAKAAAQFLEEKMQPNDLLGFGWGETISRTIEHLYIDPNSEISVVTLTGGVNYYFQKQNHSLEGGLDKFKGRIHVIPSPFLTSTEEMAANILSEPSVKNILDLATLSKHTIVGVGGLSPDATIVREEKMTVNELTFIKNQHAVGDILGQFYTIDGEVLDLPHHKRLIGTPLSKLKEMNNVIAVAGGKSKVEAIYGALKGGYIHTMITDEETASSLIQLEVHKKDGLYSGF